jgi:hypothetical protein
MPQRVVTSNTQIVSGTEIMRGGPDVDHPTHTRELAISVPKFASQPDITISIYSDESSDLNPYSKDESNSGTTFAPWSIEYRPLEGVDGWDLIAISATNTDVGQPTPVRVVCSYLGASKK